MVGREAISLAPRLQPGDNKPELTMNRFLTVFIVSVIKRNRWKRLKKHFVGRYHRAKAAVLMRSLRGPARRSI